MPARNHYPYQSVAIKPVDGLLDTRSTPDEVPVGGYRWLESLECLQKGKMCRMSGYQKLLADEFTNNADLHDQLLTIAGRTIRQPIIFWYEHRLPSGAAKAFCATANVLYALNNATGNWKVIWDQCTPPESAACQEVRWSAAGFGNIVVFSNGVDPVQGHVIDQPADDEGQSVFAIRDLGLLKISKVGFVKQFAGLTLYCNVVEDATRKSYRTVWSDYQNPLSIKPKASASLAGDKDLDFGEVILNAEELANSLEIYTSRGIWQADVGGDAGLTFARRYSADRPGDRCLVFPRTLVSTGAEHYYLSGDGLYMFSQYVVAPQRVDWIHKATAVIFDDLSPRCLTPCAGHEPLKKQLWFSWARTGETCPSQSLIINTEFPFASIVPKGFTAFGNFGFIRQKSLRSFLLERCVCDADGLDDNGLGFVKEGGFCTASDDTPPGDCIAPASLWTPETVDLDGREVEDFTKPEDDYSFCVALSGLSVEDVCQAESEASQCNPLDLFVMASSDDFCLKQTSRSIYYRERATDFTAGGCGTYLKEGYLSLLRSGPVDLALPEAEKIISRFSIEAHPEEQTIPSVIRLRVGGAGQAIDPNKVTRFGRCVIMYQDQEDRDLVCQSTLTEEEHASAGTRPDEDLAWALHMVGKFFYYEITIANPKVDPPDTGGAVCLSRFTFRVNARAPGKM